MPPSASAASSATSTVVADLRIWVNGHVCADPAEATVAVTDHGLVVGDGVFEALKVTGSGAFAIRRHLLRMERSAAALGLPAPDSGVVREAIEAVLAGRRWEHGKVRITYTGGRGPLGSQAAFGPPTLVVAAEPVEPTPATTAITTAPWSRNEHGALTGVKSTSYAENVRALAFAAARGSTEAILLNTAGNVCEGTGTNLFAVFGSTAVTPPLSAGPLAGITRELILEWCDVEERDLTLPEALAADEVFLTSSLRDVQGVVRWDEHQFPGRRPVTEMVAARFTDRSAALVDP